MRNSLLLILLLLNLITSALSLLAPFAIPLISSWSTGGGGTITGTVTNHPSIDNGDTITTSSLTDESLLNLRRNSVVTTKSGSKYKLGSPSPSPSPSPSQSQSKVSSSAKLAAPPIALNGKKLAFGKYLLAGSPKRSTSGKSQIWDCVKEGGNEVSEFVYREIVEQLF